MRQLFAGLRRDPPWGLLVAVLVYVLLRALILYTAFDETAMAMYELYPMGTLPKVLLEGGRIPLDFYYDNAAGQILTGLVTLPYYLVFGETYLALKLVPATFGLGALILVWIFLNANFSRVAANAGALLFAVGPTTTLAKYSLMASGNHFENLFFTMLVLVCFYRMHTVDAARRGRWLVITGLTAGFSIFVFLGALVPVGLLVLYHLGVRGWRGFGRDLLRLLPAFVLGIGPLLYLNLATGGRGLFFLSTRFGEEKKREHGVLERAREFLFEELPRAGFFDSFLGMSSRVANLVFVSCFAAAWVAALFPALRGAFRLVVGALAKDPSSDEEAGRFRGGKLVPLVLYLPLTALAYGVSDLILGNHTPPIECAGYRYYLPTFLFAVLLLAIFFGDTRDAFSRAGRRFGTLLYGLAFLTGFWNLSYLDLSLRTPNLGVHYVGHNFVQAARGLLSPKNGLDDDEVRGYADDFRPLHRRRLYSGLGFYKALEQWTRRKKLGRADHEYLDVDALLAGWPAEMHVDMLRGAGSFTRAFERMVPGNQGLVLGLLTGLEQAGDARHVAISEGASTPKDYPQVFLRTKKNLGDALVTLKEAPPALQPAYARGCGILCGRLLRRDIPAEVTQVDQFAHAVPASLSDELLYGIGVGLADGGEEPALPPSALALVPAIRRAPLLGGFGDRLSVVFGADEARAFAEALPGDLRAGVLAGIHE